MSKEPTHGSGSGTQRLYKVEVRTTYPSPAKIGDFVITGEWRVLPIRHETIPFAANIPSGWTERVAAAHGLGLCSFEAAQAHRFAFLATLEAASTMGSLCIQTRLVQIELTYTYATKETGVSCHYNATEDMRSLKFDPREIKP